MNAAIVVWWKLKKDRIGLSSGKNVCSASASGCASCSVLSSAGTPVRLTRISGVEVAEQVLEVGREVAEVVDRRAEVVRRALQVVHERIACCARSPRAAPSSPCSRRGRSGRSRTSRASASSREAVASKARFEFTISSRSAPRRSLIAPNTSPGVPDQVVHGDVLLVEHLHQLRAVDREALEVAERVVQVLAAVALRDRAVELLDPVLERLPRLRVERREDLVELGRCPRPASSPAGRRPPACRRSCVPGASST